MVSLNTTSLKGLTKHLNFFRYHLLFFTFTPLIFSGIFYGANGKASPNKTAPGVHKVEYIDSLFLCFSAMTTTGLVTINVSSIQPFQQVLLFLLFIVGDFSFVSLIMVLVRKRFFRKQCAELLRGSETFRPSRTKSIFIKPYQLASNVVARKRFRPEHVSAPVEAKPVDDYALDREVESPVDFNPSEQSASSHEQGERRSFEGHFPEASERSSATVGQSTAVQVRADQPGTTSSSAGHSADHPAAHKLNGRAGTIHITGPTNPVHTRQVLRARTRGASLGDMPHAAPGEWQAHAPLRQTSTKMTTTHPPHLQPLQLKHKGLGGFPSPLRLAGRLLTQETASVLRQRLGKPAHGYSLSLHRTHTHVPGDAELGEHAWHHVRATVAHWMPSKIGGLVIGRNSRFFTEELDDEELQELGGVEYRALRLLSRLVPTYIIVSQVFPFAVLAIYFAKVNSWNAAFQTNPGVQENSVNATWASLFVVVSAYTGCGMSLIDQSLIPFATCYLQIYVLVVVLLAGNHALPMMLRLIIWVGTKIWRKGELHETLHFLLDHPRRCFLYLFPSHQTWYLLLLLIAFIGIEMFGFLVLNIGLPVLQNMSSFQRFSDALIQSLSVRASGLTIVSVGNMAPAVLFLYIILMYVAIYPIAMSVRSTNVYEEQALGVYEPEDPDANGESEPAPGGRKHEIFSKYLAWHVRRQLAFDIWPLALAIFLICIVERDQLLDAELSTWFTIFRVIFECTSGYATIGLSLGTPDNNFSFCGEFKTLSKLILIVVMLRGRHRGLPVAIDRAILLPQAYARIDRRASENSPGTDEPEAPDSGPSRTVPNEGQQSVRLKTG